MKKFQKIFGVFEKRRIAPRKGGKHHQLSNEKGGENVEPNSREFYKQCAFQKFCNTVLHNEACDTHRELRRHKAKEVTFMADAGMIIPIGRMYLNTVKMAVFRQ